MSFFLLQISDAEFKEMPYGRTHMIIAEAPDEEAARCIAVDQVRDSDYPRIWLDRDRTTCEELVHTGVLRIVDCFSMGSG